MDPEFIKERIAAKKLQIIAYEDAILALSNGVQSYSLNTGQSQQSVTRTSLAELRTTVTSLYNDISTLSARINGSGVTRVIPTW